MHVHAVTLESMYAHIYIHGSGGSTNLFEGVEFHVAKPNSQWQNYVERSIQIFKKMVRSMFNISKNVSWPSPSLFEAQLLFSYIANLMNEIPYSSDLENNLLCPNSFIKISNVGVEGPPSINSKFKSINRMSEILCKNYEVAKKVRDREIINGLNKYKNISHNASNSIAADLKPYLGQAIFVDYPGKFNSLKFGTVVGIINPGTIRIKFQDKTSKDIPARLVHPLFIPELGGSFLNKTFPQLNGQE